jgi:LacI family transcriptional regulator
LVQIDRAVGGVDCDFVGVDDREGIKLLVTHALSLRRRRIAYVGGDDRSWSGWERHTAFAGLAERWRSSFTSIVRLGEFSEHWGRLAAEELFALPDPPDAVICGNDLIAVGVVEVCERRGIKVPDEVVVSGYDDIGLARMCRPSLTTVRQPINELTEQAIDLLLTRARDRDRPASKLLLQTKLIVRQSMPLSDLPVGIAARQSSQS